MDCFDFTPAQRDAIAKVESLLAMRIVSAQWRALFCSKPAAAVEPNPCAEAVAAGTFFFQGEAA